MNIPVIIILLIPLLTAIVLLLVRVSNRAQRLGGVIGSASLFGASISLLFQVRTEGILVMQAGGWPAPFGITLVVDLFSAIMVVLAGLMGLAVSIYSLVSIDKQLEAFGYYPLLQILLMGVCGAFLTGDLFNLYVWFEVMLIASFVLLALGSSRAQLEGAIKYVALNLISSGLFLAAAGIIYGVTGTLNMADLAGKLPFESQPALVTTMAMLFLVAFGIKAAAFPLFFWLPASYHTPPPAVSAIFAGLLTKVGVYALIRVFTLLFVHDTGYTHTLLLVIAGLTMISGVLGALAQQEFRRILSFHIVSQIGYMILGLALYTPLALAGGIFYIMHHIIVKTNLFLVSGVAQRLHGTGELKRQGGLYRSHAPLAFLFLIPALSLAGLPPLSGFYAKLVLVKAGLLEGRYGSVAVALGVSVLTLLSMTKIWNEAFWKAAPGEGESRNVGPALAAEGASSGESSSSSEAVVAATAHGDPGVGARLEAHPPTPPAQLSTRELRWVLVPIAGLALCTVMIGLAAEPFLNIAMEAATQLLDPDEYIRAVLGGGP